MAKVYVSSVIDAPASEIWERIRDFNGLPKWHPRIADSQIENGEPSDRVGCVRSFRLQNGDQLREKLIALSDYDMSYSYAILQTPMPLTDYVATLKVTPITDGDRCFAEWSAEFECAPDKADELTKGLATNVFQGGFDALKRRFTRASGSR